MNNIEAARIMMDGPGGNVTKVNKLIIANGEFAPSGSIIQNEMWDKVKVATKRYYNQQNPFVYNWNVYDEFFAGSAYHIVFKMGDDYEIDVRMGAKSIANSSDNETPITHIVFNPSYSWYMYYGFINDAGTGYHDLDYSYVDSYVIYANTLFAFYKTGIDVPLFITSTDNELKLYSREDYTLYTAPDKYTDIGKLRQEFWTMMANPENRIRVQQSGYTVGSGHFVLESSGPYRSGVRIHRGAYESGAEWEDASYSVVSTNHYTPWNSTVIWHSVSMEELMYHIAKINAINTYYDPFPNHYKEIDSTGVIVYER